MVVDGKFEFVGGETGKAARAITDAAKAQKGRIELVVERDKLVVRLADFPAHEPADIFLAIAEDNLASNVGRGENSGQRLIHQSVVRELKKIGALNAPDETAQVETVLELQPRWKKENLRLVVFVQETGSRHILAAGRIDWE
jgi:hypothetical protein